MKPKGQKTRSGSENRQRHPRVYARVSEAERAKIESYAAAHGMSVGAYLRWLAIDHPETRAVRRPLADVQLLAQIKGPGGQARRQSSPASPARQSRRYAVGRRGRRRRQGSERFPEPPLVKRSRGRSR